MDGQDFFILCILCIDVKSKLDTKTREICIPT